MNPNELAKSLRDALTAQCAHTFSVAAHAGGLAAALGMNEELTESTKSLLTDAVNAGFKAGFDSAIKAAAKRGGP
jgi:hypothetical protein